MDLSRTVTYRGFALNVGDIASKIVPGPGLGTGIVGCTVESATLSDVDVVQFMEKRSQSDGMDVGTPFLGVRRIRMTGTLYNVSRNLLYDDLCTLRAALNPILAAREEPLDYGYRPLYFSWPTNRLVDYPSGQIDLMVHALPRAFDAMFSREQTGGPDSDALAIPWQATFICRDPGIYGADPVEYDHTDQPAEVTGWAATASTDLISHAPPLVHGLVAGDRVRLTAIGSGGAGLNTTTTYYVLDTGLTTTGFKVGTTALDASLVNITSDATGVNWVKSFTDSGSVTNRGTYLSAVNGLWMVGPSSGTISATIGDSTFTISIPASTGTRTIRFKGQDKVLTVEENGVELPRMDLIAFSGDTTWPLISPGPSNWSITFHGCDLSVGSRWWFNEQYA